MKSITDATLREKIYFARSRSGMPVYVWPKKGLRKKFALIAVRYGSIDERVVAPGGGAKELPAGAAHFLEHRLFDVDGRDVSDEFSALGASVNAMTSFRDTTYYFSCTDGFDKCARLLLSIVGKPVFEAEKVEREKQIITQEILMSGDNPAWRVFFGLMKSMFASHPVRNDIGGTVESVSATGGDDLAFCHGSFYRPSNMIFVAAGDMNPRTVLKTVEAASGRLEPDGARPETVLPSEKARPFRKKFVERMSVSRPKFLLGLKDISRGLTPSERYRRSLLTALLLDTILGGTSELYGELYNRGLIDETFGVSHSCEGEIGYTVMGGDTDDPDALKAALLRGFARARRKGLRAAEFRRKKRKALGRFLMHFNSAESCAASLANFILRKVNIFDYLAILEGLKVSDAEERLREHLRGELSATAVILPVDGGRR